MKNSNAFKDNPLNDIWCEKYRPQSLDDIILPDRLKNTFRRYIKNDSIPNIMLISPSPGTGKTSIAKILAKELDACMLEINGSNNNGIDVVRNDITEFIRNTTVTGEKKIVLIDEADGLSFQAQSALQSFVEQHVGIVRFIFTANNEFEFKTATASRFEKIYFEVDDVEYKEMINMFTTRVVGILESENIKFSEKVVFKTIKDNFPNYRDCWQNLSTIYNSYGEITKSINITKKTITSLIEAINTKNLGTIRITMTAQTNVNYKIIYSKLLERIDDFKGFKIESLVSNIAEWNYKNSFVADKNLNFLGMCADLIMDN